MERSFDKTSVDQKTDLKDRKHEGARENRPGRPLAADGKQEMDAEDKAAREGNEAPQPDLPSEDVEANEGKDLAAGQTEETETRKAEDEDEKDPASQAV